MRRRRSITEPRADLIRCNITVEVQNGASGNRISTIWRVRGDLLEEDTEEESEYYYERGLKNFDFTARSVSGARGRKKRVNFFELLQRLWPGDPVDHLNRINKEIMANARHKDKAKLCTIKEY